MKNQFDLCWFLGQNFIASGSHVSLVVLMRKVDDNLMIMIILHTFTRFCGYGYHTFQAHQFLFPFIEEEQLVIKILASQTLL